MELIALAAVISCNTRVNEGLTTTLFARTIARMRQTVTKLLVNSATILLIASLLTACGPQMQTDAGAWQYASTQTSVWQAMRHHFVLPHNAYRYAVKEQIYWYMKHPSTLNKIIENSRPYIFYIYQQTQRRGLPAELALLPVIESQYDPFAISRVGAGGLWQMMPGTASGFGLKINWWYDGRRDVVASTKAAFDYLTYLHALFGKRWLLAIAAYDSGEGTVAEAIEYNRRRHRFTDFWHLPLPYETRTYVPKLLAVAAIINNPSRYHLHIPNISDTPYFTEVHLGGQIDLAQAAKLANISLQQIRRLNPGHRRWATDPDGPHKLLIPITNAHTFQVNLKKLDKAKHVTWAHHLVRPGDTLGKLAVQYHTRVSILQQVNHLHSDMLQVRQSLLIPASYHGRLTSHVIIQRARIAESNVPGPHRIAYRVKRGDSFWSVARRYHLKNRQIRFWNNLTSKHRLKPGEVLVLWVNAKYARPRPPALYVYHVRRGDSLAKIAKRFHSTITTIKQASHLHSDLLHIGQRLYVPGNTRQYARYYKHHHHSITHYQRASTAHTQHPARYHQVLYKIKAGDNLRAIAKQYHTTVTALQKWNNLAKSQLIHPGQTLAMYLPVH